MRKFLELIFLSLAAAMLPAAQNNLQIYFVDVEGGAATLKMMLVNMRAGSFISEHDEAIGTRMATVLAGGDVEGGTQVTEAWLLDWERKLFCELLRTPQTQERINAMLKTGKPLRN